MTLKVTGDSGIDFQIAAPITTVKVQNTSIDSIKLLFAVTVVIMHGFLLDFANPGYWVNFLVNGFFKAAVPFYFLVSGYFFYKAVERKSIKKWFYHISKIYLLWSVMYLYALKDIINLANASLARKVYLIFRAEFTGVVHLWFIPALIIAASLCYLMRGQLQKRTRQALILCVTLWMLGVILNWTLLSAGSPNSFLFRNGIFYGTPMFILGFIVSKHHEIVMLAKIKFKTLIVISLLFVISESAIITTAFNHIQGNLLTSVDMMVSTPFLSLLIFILCLKRPNFNLLGHHTRVTSTFMYYSHIIFLDLFVLIIHRLWSYSDLQTDVMATVLAIMTIALMSFALKNKIGKLV